LAKRAPSDGAVETQAITRDETAVLPNRGFAATTPLYSDRKASKINRPNGCCRSERDGPLAASRSSIPRWVKNGNELDANKMWPAEAQRSDLAPQMGVSRRSADLFERLLGQYPWIADWKSASRTGSAYALRVALQKIVIA